MEDQELIELARKAREFSYSPYSNFKVGAALITHEGKVYSGCNIENASFGITDCAERTAIFKAVSEGAREIDTIAIIADSDGPCSPCGACRQAMAEFKVKRVIMANLKGEVKAVSLAELLPYSFAL
mgnify:FL=1